MFSRREQKKAEMRHAIVAYTMDRCIKTDFNKVHVTAICRKVGISKVTLFKYFRTKEDILLYYKSLIGLKLSMATSRNKLQGLRGLNKMIGIFTEELNSRPSMVRGVAQYLLNMRPPYRPIVVAPVERALFHPRTDFSVVEIYSIDQLVERFMLDCILEKSITKSADAGLLANQFLAMIYGTVVVTSYKPTGPVGQTFRTTMNRYVKLLK